jgi:acetyl esterase/lipase
MLSAAFPQLICRCTATAAMIAAKFFCRRDQSMTRNAILLAAVTALSSTVLAQPSGWPPPPDHLTMPIWPGAAPGAPTNLPPEVDTNTAKDPLVAGRPIVRLTNVVTPTLTLYKAKDVNGPRPAVVVFPGGGYKILAIDLEGTEVCDWLNSAGITCVLLKYRVPDTGPYPKSTAALQDAQRAMGLVRQHAAEWGIDPNRVGVLGFSAGGHLSAAISNLYEKRLYDPIDDADKLSCRPDFSVVVYPGYLANADQNFAPNAEIHPTANTPPTFIVQAEDDPVHVENAVVYFLQLKNAKVPAELHLFAQGGHGYGLRKRDLPVSYWPGFVEAWLETIKIYSGEPE